MKGEEQSAATTQARMGEAKKREEGGGEVKKKIIIKVHVPLSTVANQNRLFRGATHDLVRYHNMIHLVGPKNAKRPYSTML